MKKLLVFFAFTALVLFSNCKPDEEQIVTPETKENSIKKLVLGKWKVSFAATDDNMNGVADEHEKDFSNPSLVTFNADGTLTSTEMDGTQGGPSNVQWSISDKDIILTVPADSLNPVQTERYTILSLSTMEMLWKEPNDSTALFWGFVKQ